MQKAKTFFCVAAGVFLLALSFHLVQMGVAPAHADPDDAKTLWNMRGFHEYISGTPPIAATVQIACSGSTVYVTQNGNVWRSLKQGAPDSWEHVFGSGQKSYQ